MFGNYEYYNQSFNIQPFLIKLKNNELTLENILDEDEIIDDIKFNTDSEFIDFLTKEHKHFYCRLLFQKPLHILNHHMNTNIHHNFYI